MNEAAPRLRFDVLIACGIALVAMSVAVLALRSYRDAGVPQSFYQQNFAPAVMVACGRGFVTPQSAPQQLQDFLQLRQDAFNCEALPADLKVSAVEWNAAWVYLYRATGSVWRLTGVAWSKLDRLVGLMCGVSAAALYGILRLAGGIPAAAVIALVLTLSPVHLAQLLSLRDYSKAPFALAAIFLLGLLVTTRLRLPAMLSVAATCGAVIGIGWGFRGDLVILVPFAFAVVLALLPVPFGHRALVAAAMATLLLVTAAPVVSGMASSGCQFHLALLGLTSPVLHEMGMAPAPYQFSDQFLDASVAARVAEYSQRVLGAPAGALCSPSYESAAARLYFDLASMFPSDLIAHAYGSVLSILRSGLDLGGTGQTPWPFAGASWFSATAGAVARMTGALSVVGPLLFLGAFGVVWIRSRRLAIALAAFTLFLAGYPAIEFEGRHWFHLRFLPWFSLLIIIGADLRSWRREQVQGALLAMAAFAAILVLPLAAARSVQGTSVRGLIAQYQSAPAVPLALERNGDLVTVTWPPSEAAMADGVTADFLAVTLDGDACADAASAGPLGIGARYQAESPSHDFSTTMAIERPITGRSRRMFLPVFEVIGEGRRLARFLGFRAPLNCIAGVDRVVAGGAPSLWLQLQLPPDTSDTPLYHSIRTPRALRW
ncbi:MAG TPA: hypothetical protein VNT81_13070 [Vicinamibacterales bacterium]|nr:hypothetical protein [Vicinamibacterales bacterium]